MKIAIFHNSSLLDNFGGSELQQHLLSKYLISKGVEVDYYVISSDEKTPKIEKYEGVKYIRLKCKS
ncbi:hypothetical protein OAO35_03915, partial [Euryarchaeota archaeon]|nr:hypothetical protein [Euryarchaeota archaeon]